MRPLHLNPLFITKQTKNWRPDIFLPGQVRVLKIDAVSQMRVEYQNAIVHQARVQQAQRLREETQSKADELGDAVKSAMCPFLVLEVHRDNLIEDTLNQIYLKVSGFDCMSSGLAWGAMNRGHFVEWWLS